jgi:hypothetical protein
MSTSSEASKKITERFQSLGGWRQKTLERIRALLHAVDPEIVETWKWMGTPVFEHDGIVCTGEAYQTHVKLTFAKGASLPDPKKLFNASLDGNVRRAIDVFEGQSLDEPALKQLFRDAIALNVASKTKKKRTAEKAASTKAPTKRAAVKKAVVKKAVVKKAAVKKAAVKKAAVKKAVAKNVAARPPSTTKR